MLSRVALTLDHMTIGNEDGNSALKFALHRDIVLDRWRIGIPEDSTSHGVNGSTSSKKILNGHAKGKKNGSSEGV